MEAAKYAQKLIYIANLKLIPCANNITSIKEINKLCWVDYDVKRPSLFTPACIQTSTFIGFMYT